MALLVRFPDGHTLRFRSSFHIGRERGCDVEVADAHVSRRHAEVSLVNGTWVIRDLQSSNGLFVNGRQVDTAPIGDSAEVTLGADGPTLRIESEAFAQASSSAGQSGEDESLDSYAQRYFGSSDADDEDASVGGRTLMIRKAFQKVQQQQRRRQRVIVAAIALIAIGAGGTRSTCIARSPGKCSRRRRSFTG